MARIRHWSVVTAFLGLLLAACSPPTATEPSAVLGSSEPVSTATTTSPEAATATAEPAPSASAGLPAIAWEAPEAFDGQPSEVIVDGETWVAVGWATERGPAAWTSSDARTWERAEVIDPLPDEMFRGSGLGPTIRLGDSLLSYGTFIGCCDGRGVLGWRSVDGARWEVIESESPLFEKGYFVSGLALGEPALVAIEHQFAQFAGRIWRWTETTSWVETTPGAGSGEGSGLHLQDIVWADGRFVIVGMRGNFDLARPITATSLISTDGETWQEAPPNSEFEDVQLLEVAPMPGGGFITLGTDDAANGGTNGELVAFTSPDGLTWTAADPPAGRGTIPIEILPIEGGLVAIGRDAYPATLVWTSADGLSWTDAGRLDRAPIAAAALGDKIVVFAADFTGGIGYVIHRGTIGH